MTMKNFTKLCTVAVIIAFDIGLNSVLAYFASKEKGLKIQIQDYSFGKDVVDLLYLSFLRVCLITGVVVGILRSRNEGIQRLKQFRRTAVNISVGLCLPVAIKLLYFAEDSKKELERGWAIKALFCFAAVLNLLLLCQWSLLISIKFLPRLGGSNVNIQNEECSESEKESLLDSSRNSSASDSEEENDDEEKDYKTSPPKNKSVDSSIWKLLRYSKPDAPFLLLGFLFLLIASICEIFLPFFAGQVIDAIAIKKSYPMFKKYIVLMATVAFAASVATGLRGATFTYVMARFTTRIQGFLFQHVMQQEIGFFDTRKTGAIISRLTSDTTKMGDQISLNMNIFLRNVIRIIGILIFMAKLSWKLTIITLVGTPILVMISEAYGEYYEKLSKQVQDSLALANETAEESISSIRTVRSFAAETVEGRHYDKRLQETFKLKVKEAIAFGGYVSCTEVCFLAMEVLVLFYGGHLVMRGDLSGGNLVSFSFYNFDLSSCIEDVGNVYTSLMEAVGSSHKVFAYIERKPKIKNDGKLKPADFKGSIEFKNVSFSYPSRSDIPVLENFSFAVNPGEIIALVGPSGGGKSTVVKLLEHYYEAQLGEILIDGMPVQNYDHTFIHSRVALVAQEPTLFARSIADNIAYGIENVDKERIQEVAKQANAHQFIVDMPEGYDTQTGEKGVQLSGGQKQRVAIARALIRNPSVLILDEATSALDADSENLVQEAINRNLANRTVIVVAHRLSTIEIADKILVIEKGRLMEQGTHEELLEKGCIYARLVSKQIHGKGKELIKSNAPLMQGNAEEDSASSGSSSNGDIDHM